MASSEVMTSSTRSFAYSYRLVKKCFLKICETSKCHNFLIFQPIFIRFSLFCSENFTLSSEIKLEQLRTSPLILLNQNICKTQDFLVAKRRKMRFNHDRSFSKIAETCSPSELHGGSLFRTFNSYSFNFNDGLRKRRTGFVCFELPAREASSFCEFWKLTSCDFITFISSLIKVNFCFFYVVIKDKFT